MHGIIRLLPLTMLEPTAHAPLMIMHRLRQWLRKQRISSIEISPLQWQQAEARLPFLSHLSNAERQKLRQLVLEFLATKQMSGAQGLELHLEHQLIIALQACLLILQLGLEWYSSWVGIIVYPGDFIVPRHEMDADGIVHEFDDPVLGETWEYGPVLLSWSDPAPAIHQDRDTGCPGINVVIHEFAHKLDMLTGHADGLPPLHANMTRQAWRAAFQPAYENFCQRVDAGEDSRLDPYAADSPAEFFAVMSESFFETPQLLRDTYPDVYRQLNLFYRQHPLACPA